MSRVLSRVIKDALPDVISDRFPRTTLRRTGPDWQMGLIAAGVALGACLVAAGALAWMGRQTGRAMDKVAFNYPYDDEEKLVRLMPATLSKEQARAADRAFAPYAAAAVALLVSARAVTYLAEAGRSISPSVGIVLFMAALAVFCAGFYVRNRRRRRYLGEGG